MKSDSSVPRLPDAGAICVMLQQAQSLLDSLGPADPAWKDVAKIEAACMAFTAKALSKQIDHAFPLPLLPDETWGDL